MKQTLDDIVNRAIWTDHLLRNEFPSFVFADALVRLAEERIERLLTGPCVSRGISTDSECSDDDLHSKITNFKKSTDNLNEELINILFQLY